MNESGLWYEKPCPAGKYCPSGVTTAPDTTTSGYWTEQGATSGTANTCADGYKCEESDGNVGPYEEGCALGEWTATDTTSGCDAANCESGKYCGQGQKQDCIAGFYCESGAADWLYQECPVGTYLGSTDTGYPGT